MSRRSTSPPPRDDGGRHFGSRLLFADGYLFVTAGERGEPDRAQDVGDPAGSVIRLLDDGRVPDNNPFIGTAGARPELYSIGHRNPQGMARDAATGRIYAIEHGPKGGDELNLIEPGVNYGWPVITYGKSYMGFKIGEGTHKEGMAQPVHYWVPSISPSGADDLRRRPLPPPGKEASSPARSQLSCWCGSRSRAAR